MFKKYLVLVLTLILVSAGSYSDNIFSNLFDGAVFAQRVGNYKYRQRADIASADGAAPTTASSFIQVKDAQGQPVQTVEVSVKLTTFTACKIRPYFLEQYVLKSNGTYEDYVSYGGEITLSTTAGTTVQINGANGRPIYIMVTDVTGTPGTVQVDVGPGRIPSAVVEKTNY